MELQEIRVLPKYDTSTKQYEIQYKEYVYTKYTRKLNFKPKWRHLKYYKTLEGASDAILEIRKRGVRDYPGTELESKYPHIRPSITINRYKVVERKLTYGI